MTPKLETLGRFAGLVPLSLAAAHAPRLRHGWVFDPHRLAMPAWALSLEPLPPSEKPALLVTFDRHFDLAVPKTPPPPGLSALELDTHARRALDVRNFDHVLASMAAGLIGDAVVLARTQLPECPPGERWVDPRGHTHRWVSARSPSELLELRWPQTLALIDAAPSVLLDVDLDCFTSPNDASPTEAVRWPLETVREFLRPPGGDEFWRAVLPKTVGLTFAREPGHCGGLVSAARLFDDVAQVLFAEVLGAGLP